MAATATASSPSPKSIPIITRSPRRIARPCSARRPSTPPRRSACAPPRMTTATIEGSVVEVDDEPMSAEPVEAEATARARATRRPSRPRAEEAESASEESAAETLRRKRQNLRRRYKIQDVIRRRQVLLVQVVKEERGNKGAALTTYLSPRRPLLRADAQHQPWRRHQPQDLERRRPQAPEADHGRSEPAERDGPDRAHRRPVAHQDRDQARLRLSRAAVGRGPREDAEIGGAGADLPGQRPRSSAPSATSTTATSTRSSSRAPRAIATPGNS